MTRLLSWPDPILARKADPVDEFGSDLAELISLLLDALYRNKARAIGAPRIGVSQRVFVMDASWRDGARGPRAFVNPTVISRSERQVVTVEKCLTVGGAPRRIARPDRIEVSWCDSDGETHRGVFEGFEAVAVQHEMDHLDGITILDHPEAR